jgi:hypothetical protein
VGVIITCPNCDAKYEVAVGVVMRRPKLKCAECNARWVPAEEIDEDEAVAAVQEEVRAARQPPPPEPEPEAPPPEPEPEPEEPREQSTVLKWLVAVALGAAFTAASFGLWVGRIDPEAMPLVSEALEQVAPSQPLLDVAVEGRVTRVPGGVALLEVTGTITNRTKARITVPPLQARLMVGGLRIRDWTIPPPAASVGPDKQISFASSLTDVPEGQVTVQVRFGR